LDDQRHTRWCRCRGAWESRTEVVLNQRVLVSFVFHRLPASVQHPTQTLSSPCQSKPPRTSSYGPAQPRWVFRARSTRQFSALTSPAYPTFSRYPLLRLDPSQCCHPCIYSSPKSCLRPPPLVSLHPSPASSPLPALPRNSRQRTSKLRFPTGKTSAEGSRSNGGTTPAC